MPEPRLSVVVCTHDRPLDLAHCLDALERLDLTVEVIVVDSASEPPCKRLVERYADAIPGIRYVREDGPGLSRARNRGIGEARGRARRVHRRRHGSVRRAGPGTSSTRSTRTRRSAASGGACVAVFDEVSGRPRWLSDRLLQFAGITRFGTRPREARSSAEWPFGANIAFRVEALPGDQPFLRRARPHRRQPTLRGGMGARRERARGGLEDLARTSRGRRAHSSRRALRVALLLAAALVGWRVSRALHERGCTAHAPADRRRPVPVVPVRAHAGPGLPVPNGRDRRIPRRACSTAPEDRAMSRRALVGALPPLCSSSSLSVCGSDSTTPLSSTPTATSTCSWPAESASTCSLRPCWGLAARRSHRTPTPR